jgi:MFS family permease
MFVKAGERAGRRRHIPLVAAIAPALVSAGSRPDTEGGRGGDGGGALAVDGLARVRSVLGARDYRVLLGARFASQVAEGAFLASAVNAVIFAPERQSTVHGFAVATVLTLLPFSLIEPVAGVFVDRYPRRPILVVLPLVRAAAAILVLPAVGAVAALYAGTLIVFSLNRLFTATAGAVIPRVVQADAQGSSQESDALLFTANMITAVAGTVALFGGILAGGLVAGAGGATAVIVFTGVVWVAAAVLAARLSGPLPPERTPAGSLRGQLLTTVLDLGDGFRRIGRTPAALAPILTVAAGQFLQVLVIAAALVVIRELGGGLITFSGLVAAGGVGVFLGFTTAGAMRLRLPSEMLIGVAFVLSAVALLPAAIVTLNSVTLTVGAVLLGASYGWTRVPVDTLAQQAVPDRYRGRVFTAIDLAFNTSRVLAAVAAVVVVPFLGPRMTFVVMAVLFLVWAPVVPLWLHRGRSPAS